MSGVPVALLGTPRFRIIPVYVRRECTFPCLDEDARRLWVEGDSTFQGVAYEDGVFTYQSVMCAHTLARLALGDLGQVGKWEIDREGGLVRKTIYVFAVSDDDDDPSFKKGARDESYVLQEMSTDELQKCKTPVIGVAVKRVT